MLGLLLVSGGSWWVDRAELEAENAALRARVAEQDVEIAALRVQVAELVARLDQNPRNSSKPPSSEGQGHS